MKAGRIIKVEFSFLLPAEASKAEIEEWVRFELRANSQISILNPLFDREIKLWKSSPVLTDTHLVGREETVAMKTMPDGSVRYGTRYVEDPA